MVAAVAVSSAGTKKRKSSKTTTTTASTNTKNTTFHSKKKKNGHQTNRSSNSSSKKAKTTTTTTRTVVAVPAANSSNSNRPPHQRRHAEVVKRGKILWNSLRRKNITKEERRVLLDELIPLLLENGAKPHKIALQHDGSRLVQAILQFGTAADRVSSRNSTMVTMTATVAVRIIYLSIWPFHSTHTLFC
jgi:hypothetical protein